MLRGRRPLKPPPGKARGLPAKQRAPPKTPAGKSARASGKTARCVKNPRREKRAGFRQNSALRQKPPAGKSARASGKTARCVKNPRREKRAGFRQNGSRRWQSERGPQRARPLPKPFLPALNSLHAPDIIFSSFLGDLKRAVSEAAPLFLKALPSQGFVFLSAQKSHIAQAVNPDLLRVSAKAFPPAFRGVFRKNMLQGDLVKKRAGFRRLAGFFLFCRENTGPFCRPAPSESFFPQRRQRPPRPRGISL